MNGFVAYALACILIVAILVGFARSLPHRPWRVPICVVAALAPMWIGLGGIYIFGSDTFGIPYSKFAEEWTWAWGLSHMAFFAPTLISTAFAIKVAWPAKLKFSSQEEKAS
jgi:hypothetical protein